MKKKRSKILLILTILVSCLIFMGSCVSAQYILGIEGGTCTTSNISGNPWYMAYGMNADGFTAPVVINSPTGGQVSKMNISELKTSTPSEYPTVNICALDKNENMNLMVSYDGHANVYYANGGSGSITGTYATGGYGSLSGTLNIPAGYYSIYIFAQSNCGAKRIVRLSTKVYFDDAPGGTVAWNDITGKPALAAASHDHSSISGNAATATYATSAGNADTVDGSHAAAFAASTHNHSGQTLAVNISGNATTATNATYATSSGNADTVDSKHASDFTVAGGTVAWSNVTGKPTTVEGYGITDGQRQMFTVIKGFKFDAYAVGSYTSPMGLATTSILSGAATKITGTLSTAGPTVVDCSSNKKLYFNVIEAPTFDTTATVTFM